MRKFGLLVGIMLIMSLEARAEFFKYKDNSGTIVITDKLENVPPKYRNQLKVIWDKDLEAKDPLKRRWAASKELQEKQEQEQNQQKSAEKKKQDEGKPVVISIEEATGQLVRTLE